MHKKMVNGRSGRRRILFKYFAPHAAEVLLMGDFNGWNPKKHPMKKEDDGQWVKITYLKPGRHEYRFLVDGDWYCDPSNDKRCQNRYGTFNNIIDVK